LNRISNIIFWKSIVQKPKWRS